MRRNRVTALFAAVILVMAAFVAPAQAEEPAGFLDGIKGTYESLFPVITAPEYDAIWLEKCTQYAGADAAEASAAQLKAVCLGTLYGQEAIDAFAANPEAAMYNCSFIGGVSKITFDGNAFSGVSESGETVFSHTYKYVGINEAWGAYQYQSEDADAGEFTYFVIFPDTMASTYHIEFRYGSDLEALAQFDTGAYAYWLVGAIAVETDAATIESCIDLFCSENLAAEE